MQFWFNYEILALCVEEQREDNRVSAVYAPKHHGHSFFILSPEFSLLNIWYYAQRHYKIVTLDQI